MNSSVVFVDIEWDQAGKRASKKDPIIEIGATRLDTDEVFLNYIRGFDEISWRTLKILGLDKKHKKQTVPISQAMQALVEYSEGTNAVFVWSKDTVDKLKILANRYHCTVLLKNLFVLQDLIQKLSCDKKSISFESALIAMNVQYESMKMHNSSFDAIYLRDLFLKINEKLVEMNPILKPRVVKSSKSKIYHLADCSYLRNAAKDEYERITAIETINKRMCRRCACRLTPLVFNIERNKVIKRTEKIRSYRNKHVTDEKMYEIAEYFGLSITGGMGEAILSTGYSFWKVYCNKEGYVQRVRHENYQSTENRGKNFHSHETFPKDVFSLFEYIKWHDETLITKPISDSFEKIQKKKEKEKKCKKKEEGLHECADWRKNNEK